MSHLQNYPHCPSGPDSWCKYNIDKLNGTQSYKPGPGLPLDIIAKIKPIYADLGKDTELEKCLHGKTQNTNESFNGLSIWERIPKSNYVSLRNLEFGVNDAVAYFNIGMKASILIYEKLAMIPGKFTLRACRAINAKRLSFADYKSFALNRLTRQSLRAKKL